MNLKNKEKRNGKPRDSHSLLQEGDVVSSGDMGANVEVSLAVWKETWWVMRKQHVVKILMLYIIKPKFGI